MRGFRKYSLAFLALATAFTLALLSKLTSDFVTVVSIVVGSYNLANAGVAFANRNKPLGPTT